MQRTGTEHYGPGRPASHTLEPESSTEPWALPTSSDSPVMWLSSTLK